MHSIIEGFAAAFRLIITLNPELWRIILLSLQVSGTALLLATVLGLPLGAYLALRRVPLRGLVISQFPVTDTLRYTPEQMAVILTLPPGSLTQRTMIYAVRIHPDRPARHHNPPKVQEIAERHWYCYCFDYSRVYFPIDYLQDRYE